MLWKKVTKVAATAGAAEGSTPLNAFDNALLAAGIGNINLIKVSSIVPPDVDIVDLPRIKPGALIPTAYAEATGDVPGQVVSAAVGYALPEDRTRPGGDHGVPAWSPLAQGRANDPPDAGGGLPGPRGDHSGVEGVRRRAPGGAHRLRGGGGRAPVRRGHPLTGRAAWPQGPPAGRDP